jgi:hypothetical protein
MKRTVHLFALLLPLASLVGCVSAKQQREEQQELDRSIQKTSNPDSVRGCAFIMTLRPDARYDTVEAQVASLVIPKKGVTWAVLDASGTNQLYSCEASPSEPTPRPSTPTSVEAKPEPGAVPPVAAPAPQARSEPGAGVPEAERSDTSKAAPAPAPTTEGVSRTRVTSNPEAVKGCRFLASFSEFEPVSRFQENVVRTGGNLGYVVATNKDGEVIGESYSCSGETKP